MNLDLVLRSEIQKAFNATFSADAGPLQLQPTNKEFEGSHTLLCFPLAKLSKKNPEETGRILGDHLVQHSGIVSRYNVVKGFLNLVISDDAWINVFKAIAAETNFGILAPNGQEIMVEYSSPNTNKPLHLGHLRNNFLGWSVAELYKAMGYVVHKVQIINDRGIHICKSMAAWQLFGEGETPQSSGTKGDHLVGKYYVAFDRELKKQLKPLLADIDNGTFLSGYNDKEIKLLQDITKDIAKLSSLIETEKVNLNTTSILSFGSPVMNAVDSALGGIATWRDVLKALDAPDYSDLDTRVKEQRLRDVQKLLKPLTLLEDKIDEKRSAIKEIAQNKTAVMGIAQDLLRKWEAKDPGTVQLWKQMNGWVYEGFATTYKRMGVDFEKLYYESDTYLLGKEEVMRGVREGVFFIKDDGSVWVDLTSDGLDEKLLLRSDGTSVYMTQDIGTAILRFHDFPKISRQVYTVGNEQEYHFKVLFLILAKLGYAWAKECYHLSYGMVDLPTGKMKSREGTVVDADDLMQEMVQEADKQSMELGKIEDLSQVQKTDLAEMVGLAALKYFLLKVDPKKRMMFDPAESIQLQGHTGPFIQYTHARVRAILRKAKELGIDSERDVVAKTLEPAEREVIRLINAFPSRIAEAAREYSPALIANYAFDLAREYNQFYQSIPIFNESDREKLQFRIAFSSVVADTIKQAMGLLGIRVPERM